MIFKHWQRQCEGLIGYIAAAVLDDFEKLINSANIAFQESLHNL